MPVAMLLSVLRYGLLITGNVSRIGLLQSERLKCGNKERIERKNTDDRLFSKVL